MPLEILTSVVADDSEKSPCSLIWINMVLVISRIQICDHIL